MLVKEKLDEYFSSGPESEAFDEKEMLKTKLNGAEVDDRTNEGVVGGSLAN